MSLLVFFLIKLLFGLIDQVALAFIKLIVLHILNELPSNLLDT